MSRRQWSSLLFLAGLGLLLAAVLGQIPVFGHAPTGMGQAIAARAPVETGAANAVAAVVLSYRGLDTLGELAILFVAATTAGMLLGAPGGQGGGQAGAAKAGFVLRAAADLLFPFLLILGGYLLVHGHLLPGGGFQGGAVLATAYFVPLLARPESGLDEGAAALLEGLTGVAFIAVGLLGLLAGNGFLAPLIGAGIVGELFSAGSLPLLYLAVGLKVGSELAGLLLRLQHGGAEG